MPWIKLPFFKSVKLRIATVYAGLLTLSFATVFVVVFFYSKLELYTLMDRDLAGTVSRLGYEYMTGKALPVDYTACDRKDFKRLGVRLQKIMPGFQLYLAFEGVQSDSKLALGKVQNQVKTAVLGSDGKWIFTDITRPADSEKHIQEFTRQMPDDGRQLNYFWICNLNDKNVFGSSVSARDMQWISKLQYKIGRRERYEIIQLERHRLRVAYRIMPDNRIVAAARSLHDFDSGFERMMIFFAGAAGVVLFLSFICSYLIAWRLCRGVDAVSAAADAIANGDYSRRVMPHNSGSEIDRMMKNFNAMIGNTEKLMDELRTISDNIAHDLRTPLTRMLGRAELAVTGNMDQQAYEDAFAANVEECRRMLTLINTMLDITKTESGTNKLHLEEFDLAQLLDQSIELFSMLAEQKNIQLRCRVPEMQVKICGDRTKIQQMIANLLDNAIKFTADGGLVDVNLQLERSAVNLSVRDTGCGMTEEESKQVFKRFYRADSSRSLPGNGLGLSLVQAIVNAHGGVIELSSQPGEGTFIWVSLPQGNHLQD